VNHLVLSGTATHVPSGTRSSCYRGPESGETFFCSTTCRARNFTNWESFGFFLTDRAFSAVEDSQPSAEGNAAIGVLLTGNAGSEAAPAPYRLIFPAQPLSCEGAIA
jgi:hypothetical protein